MNANGSQPLASVIIDNYNYARYLPEAIESALQQTYPNVEVIVVDDGSTDTSRQVLESFGGRIIPLYQENRGQASAFNTGFLHASGMIAVFLDADDVLLPHMVHEAVKVFVTDPTVAKVQFRVEVVDSAGRPSGAVIPAPGVRLPQGDVRREVLQFPDDIPYPPTSGNVFAAWALREIFPIPESAYDQVGADLYLCNLTSLVGSVVSLDMLGALYRVHESNYHFADTLALDQVRRIIARTRTTHVLLKQFADSHSLTGLPDDPTRVLSVTFLAHRATSLKLEPLSHPIVGDTVRGVCTLGCLAAIRRFDVPVTRRVVYAAWFLAMFVVPRPAARWLAEQSFYPMRRWRLSLVSRRNSGTATERNRG